MNALADILGLWTASLTLATGAVVIALAGPRLAETAGRLSHRAGLGQAVGGALLLGAATSLPGLTVSATTAASGAGGLAVANALGGIAAQTVFLAVADFANPGVNLEHAAADPGNMTMTALLAALLAGVLLAMLGPEVALGGRVHPMSLVLLLAYLGGIRVASATTQGRSWRPARSRYEVETGSPEDRAEPRTTKHLALVFVVAAVLTLASGWAIGGAALALARETGLGDGIIGGLFTAVATSSAELVTAVAAVRSGALALAIGDIVGGNVFDVLFVAAADVAYGDGSIYHAVSPREQFLTALCIALTAAVMMGLVRREPGGPANVGFESVAVLVLYVAGFVVAGLAW